MEKLSVLLILLFTSFIIIFSSHTFAGRYDGISKIIKHTPPPPRVTSNVPAYTPSGGPPNSIPVQSMPKVEAPAIPPVRPSFNYNSSPLRNEFNRAGGTY